MSDDEDVLAELMGLADVDDDKPKKSKKKKDKKDKEKDKDGEKKKKKKKKKDNDVDVEEDDSQEDAPQSPVQSPSKVDLDPSEFMSPSKVKKYSADYFESMLAEIRDKCDKKIKIKSSDRDKFLDACHAYYECWGAKWENEQWLNQLLENNGSQEEIDEAQAYVDESAAAMPKLKTKCIKAALKVFDKIDEDKMDSLEDKLVKGAIVAQATPQYLADFAAQSKENEKLLKKLFGDAELMRDMLRFGGPTKYQYGNAIRIYEECVSTMKDLDKKWEKLNKKIALACALEFAGVIREFDSSVEIDGVARYHHYADAHKNGELDPAFPNFSVWEMRQIVNCDAPNEQMKWCRDMVMNYVPHITFITDEKLRYTYILDTDVRIRKPTWTASPRTYPMILSGGGNQSINSWFGRFLLKSFGLPTWGAKERKFDGYCRWTPDGWEPMHGTKWETSTWQGKTGEDFKIELEARNKAPQQEYWKKLVMLQAFADVIDGDPGSIPEHEVDVLHPERFWRSMAIVSMALLFQTEPEVERTFKREGKHLVETRNEKYKKKYEADLPDDEITDEDGVITIPASRHGFQSGNVMVIDSYEGTKQVNFLADGVVEYEIPDTAEEKTYTLTMEVCTVSAKQNPLSMKINDDDSSEIKIKIPYTMGSWQTMEGPKVNLEPGSMVKFSRPKGSLGLAIKKFIFS
eukprot:Nitzschia sp. Nitz4//scaffold141_size107518//90842//92902//NITZ4_004296-RA/size107518-processed-gene-0.119-mRNA-1//1//CDS//3329536348//3954//frame0